MKKTKKTTLQIINDKIKKGKKYTWTARDSYGNAIKSLDTCRHQWIIADKKEDDWDLVCYFYCANCLKTKRKTI